MALENLHAMAEALSLDTTPLPLKERLKRDGGKGKATRPLSSPTTSELCPEAKRPHLQGESNQPSVALPSGDDSDCDSLTCSLKTCSGHINPATEKHVEIQAGLPEKNVTHFLLKCAVRWTKAGEAMFHESCWKDVLKSARARNQKKAAIKMSFEEQALVKEASKTAEFHDSFEQIKQEATRITSLIRSASHCIVFTGAGISTSAGIGDYRGKGGKWTEMDRESVTAMVAENLKESRQGARTSRQESIDEADSDDGGVPYEQLRPTYTHEALAKLLELGLLKHVISQNGDGLHGLSGIPPGNISELHGNVFLEVCEKCGHRYYRPFYVLNDHASLYFEELSDLGTTTIIKPKFAKQCELCGLSHRTGRKCEQKDCKGYLKDSIINFRDNLEEEILVNAEKHAKQADLCLSLGTTMQVTPACDLVQMGRAPLRLIIVNRQQTGFDELCYRKWRGEQLGVRVFGDCDSVMREVMGNLMSENDLRAWESQRGDRMKLYDNQRQ